MMQSFPWPFTSGIQNGEARISASPQPRLTDAVNVHVRPENLNALSIRPRASRSLDSNPEMNDTVRLARAGRGIARIGDLLFDLNSAGIGNTFTTPTAPGRERPRVWSVSSVTDYYFSQVPLHSYVAYAERANGDCAVFVASSDETGEAGRLSVQLTANGIRYPEAVITDDLYSDPSTLGDTPVFFAFQNTSNGYSVICTIVDGSDLKIALFVSTSATAVPQFVAILEAPSGADMPKLRSADMYKNSQTPAGQADGILYAYTRGNAVRVGFCDSITGDAFATSATIVTPAGGVPYNGCAAIATVSNVTYYAHLYVDTGDSTELTLSIYRVTFVPNITSSLQDTVSRTGIIAPSKYHSICGGRMRVSPTTLDLEYGSYFYVSGHNWGTLIQLGGPGTIIVSSLAAPIVPMGKLYADTEFYGCRIVGNQGSVSGLWELTQKTNGSGAFIACMPLAYYSVTNGNGTLQSVLSENVGLDVRQGFRGMCVLHSARSVKAILRNRNTGTLDLVHASIDNTARTISGGKTDMLIGGVPRYWDGVNFVPAGIPQPPDMPVTPQTNSGGSLASGTYLYALVWEWFDAAGERQQSGAQIQSVTVPVGHGTVILPALPDSIPFDERLSGEGSPVKLVAYRSAPGSDTMRRISGLELEITTALVFSTDPGWLQLVDDGTHSLGFETLYTSPGDNNELEATALEETYLLRAYGERIIYVTRSHPDQLTYTKTKRQGRAIEPNQQLNFTMQQPATGLAVQDGNVYWLTLDNVFAFNPRFADDTGLDGGGVDAIPLSPGIGCTQPHSVVETAIGVIFISARGPHIIPRGGGAPQFIGLDVERWFSQFPVCVASAFNPKTSEALFAMNSADHHCILVYNILLNQWFRWVIGDTDTGGPVKNITSLEVSQGGNLYVCANVNNTSHQTYVFDLSSEVDAIGPSLDRTVQIKIETASIRAFAGGPAEEGRIDRVAFDCSSAPAGTPQLLISESHDDGETWSTELPIQTGSRVDPPVYRLGRQRTRGVRIRMRTTYNGETNPTNQMRAPEQLAGLTVYGYKLGRATSGRQRG